MNTELHDPTPAPPCDRGSSRLTYIRLSYQIYQSRSRDMSETTILIKWKWVSKTAQGEDDEEHSRVSDEAECLTEKGQSVRFNGPGTLY